MNNPQTAATETSAHAQHKRHSPGLFALSLAALGVVYGDIGTSPLYTVKEVFSESTGMAVTPDNVIGAISSILWFLTLVVTLKYVTLILRADNHGEGGGLALTALATRTFRGKHPARKWLLLLGLFGATLFYGDSVITPAISVLGAVEGLEVITPTLVPYVMPISAVVLVLLFAVQRWGTQSVGRYFGPIIVFWFVALGWSGLQQISQTPEILAALNPVRAAEFLYASGGSVLFTVGAIVLALTGAEALYADMGHFGRGPVRLAWTFCVMPGLLLNYMGQGALLLRDPKAIDNPFFRMFPEEFLIPMVVLATLAAIIASQAVISGAYSMTRQAILLGFLPRMQIKFTSAAQSGQIFIPLVNRILLIGVLLAVIEYKSSSALAGAYGMAVSLTMVTTTALTFFVLYRNWRMPLPAALLSTAFFLVFDLFLFAGCAMKFFDGGWFPLALGLALFAIMTTWRRGRELLNEKIHQDGLELNTFIPSLEGHPPHRVHRTAVFLVSNPGTVPQALLHNLKHNHVLHEKNIILTLRFEEVPWVEDDQRIEIQSLGQSFWQVTAHYGFMESPQVPQVMAQCAKQGLKIEEFETTYFISRETVVPTHAGGMADWRERLFAAMSQNAGGVVDFFQLPDSSVVELGTRIQI
jgi:KUP system potassium uptake protein